MHGMLDAAKYADLVLLLVDGAFGFEMETFEFLNLLQARARLFRGSWGEKWDMKGLKMIFEGC